MSSFSPHLEKEHIKTIVVGMPSMKRNRALLPEVFWDEFRDFLASASQHHGAYFVDLFDDPRFVETSHFLDTVHLNRWGGGELIDIIAAELSKQKEFVAGLPRTPNQRTIENDSVTGGGRATAGKEAPLWQ